ncbi:MAG: hypothetical protein ABFD04_03590 [Syntrophomonas sp.]
MSCTTKLPFRNTLKKITNGALIILFILGLTSCNNVKNEESNINVVKPETSTKEKDPNEWSQRIVREMLVDKQELTEMLNKSPGTFVWYSYIYYDTTNDVSYLAMAEKSKSWKTNILRYHYPIFKNKRDIPQNDILAMEKANMAESPFDEYFYTFGYYRPMKYKEPIPFEERLKRINYPTEDFIFQDIY